MKEFLKRTLEVLGYGILSILLALGYGAVLGVGFVKAIEYQHPTVELVVPGLPMHGEYPPEEDQDDPHP